MPRREAASDRQRGTCRIGRRPTRPALLALVREFLRDLNPHRAATRSIEATSRLERDRDIDRLARLELALRIERHSGFAFAEAGIWEPRRAVVAWQQIGFFLINLCGTVAAFRALSSSGPTLPYIARLRVLRWVI